MTESPLSHWLVCNDRLTRWSRLGIEWEAGKGAAVPGPCLSKETSLKQTPRAGWMGTAGPACP